MRNRSGQERYSLPFFLTPDPDATLEVLDCCVEEGKKPNYEPSLVGDLYSHRILPARVKHPTSIKYRDFPKSEWMYELLYGCRKYSTFRVESKEIKLNNSFTVKAGLG